MNLTREYDRLKSIHRRHDMPANPTTVDLSAKQAMQMVHLTELAVRGRTLQELTSGILPAVAEVLGSESSAAGWYWPTDLSGYNPSSSAQKTA